ncbi:MAG: ABC transporter ATP-binding protein [Clostridia bacterium]|nr:ABC transporter ATP-binding protein [Clostridia bacterium]
MNKDKVLEVESVSMQYNLPSEKVDNIKELFIKLVKRQLRYNKFWVLKDINISLNKGESLGLIGCNGAGKSTLLKLIAGVMEPTTGTIQTNGTIAPLINLGAGFDMMATGKENVFLNGAMLGFNRKQMEEKYNRIVEFAELGEYMNVPVKNYSSGMLARLGFSIAIDVDPDILIVDEVLSVGDMNFQKKCFAKLEELKNNGTTYILVSHNMNDVKKFCDKVAWLKNGEIYRFGESSEVCSEYIKEMNKL